MNPEPMPTWPSKIWAFDESEKQTNTRMNSFFMGKCS
jgi:hypothetical protein